MKLSTLLTILLAITGVVSAWAYIVRHNHRQPIPVVVTGTTALEDPHPKHSHDWGRWGDPEHVGSETSWIVWHHCKDTNCALTEWTYVKQAK